MLLGRRYSGMLGFLWVADLLLLLLLIPGNPESRDLLIATSLWLVPTAMLVVATWRWSRRARA